MNIKQEIELPDSDNNESFCFDTIKEEYDDHNSDKNDRVNVQEDEETTIDDNDDCSLFVDTTLSKILPDRSKHLYELTYNRFIKWKQDKNIIGINEDVILEYLYHLKTISAISTLRSRITMIRSTIDINDDIDIFRYESVRLFWKKTSINARNNSSRKLIKIFCLNDIEKFLRESPDMLYLLEKVVLIISISGPCTLEDICKISIDDIEDNGIEIKLNINNVKKPMIPRVIAGESYNLFKKYLLRRPKNLATNKLLLQYHRGRCLPKPITVKGFGSMAILIAQYLNLPNANEYRGVTFHQTAVALQRQNKIPHFMPLNKKEKKKLSRKKLAAASSSSSPSSSSSSPSPSPSSSSHNNNLSYEKPKIIHLVPINNNDNDNLQPSTELFKSSDNKTLYIHVNNSKDMDIIIVKK